MKQNNPQLLPLKKLLDLHLNRFRYNPFSRQLIEPGHPKNGCMENSNRISGNLCEKAFEFCFLNHIEIIPSFDPVFSGLLRSSPSLPLLFFCKGDLRILKQKKIAMVGTRTPSLFTVPWVGSISSYLSRDGSVIVSGFAEGVDKIAHYGSTGGTIAILGQGAEQLAINPGITCFIKNYKYPALFLTEYPPFVQVQKYFFVQRNKLISSLSDIVIFCEGGEKSGANYTIKHALSIDKKVYVLNHPRQGNNDGAMQWLKDARVQDITGNFPVTRSGNKLVNKLNPVYTGNGEWYNFTCENYTSISLSPDQQVLGFEPYSD